MDPIVNQISTTEFPNVAIIMLNWNTPEMTILAIHSILKSDYSNFSIFITDNGSHDNSYNLIKHEFNNKVNVYKSEFNRGYGGGMNFCLDRANQEDPFYFLIMNNDTIIDPHAISALVETAMKYQNNCVVTGKVYFYDQKNVLQTVGNEFDRLKVNGTRIGFNEIEIGQYEIECEREMIDDIFMLLPTKIYHEVGGYATYFFMNYESTDLVLRIKDKGYKAIYTPNAKLWHKGSFSSGGLGNPVMMYWDGRSNLIIHFLHQTTFHFIKFYFHFLFKSIWGLGKGIVKKVIRNDTNIKPRIALLRGFIAGTWWLLNKKAENGKNPYSAKVKK